MCIAFTLLDTNINARYEYEYADGYEYEYKLIRSKKENKRNIGKQKIKK